MILNNYKSTTATNIPPQVDDNHAGLLEMERSEILITDFMDEDKVKAKCISSFEDYNSYLIIPKTYKLQDGKWDEKAFERLVYEADMPEHILQNARTQALGVAFKTPPTVRLPSQLMELKTNADRKGNSLDDIAKSILDSLLVSGRHSIVSNIKDGNPFLSLYKMMEMPNWRKTGGIYNYIVLQEARLNDEDEEELKRIELKLFEDENGTHVEQQIYIQPVKGGAWEKMGDVVIPTLFKDIDPIDYIPVAIAECIPALIGMTKTVRKGFRQSAIYYSMVTTLGSGKLIFFTDKDLSKIAGAHERGLTLGQGDNAKMMQLESGGADVVKAAMQDKFDSAHSQGLEIITAGANQASGDNLYLQNTNKQIKVDELGKIVSKAMTEALRTLAKMVGANEDEVDYKMNVELIKKPVDRELLKETREGIADGLLKKDEYVRAMNKHGSATVEMLENGDYDYNKYVGDVEKEQAANDAKLVDIVESSP